MPGRGLTLTATRLGEVMSSLRSAKWKHPWFTRPAWSPAAQQWVATVNPGFVNGQAPIYRATIQEQQTLGNPWEINPLTGEQFFSASVFTQPAVTVATQTVDLPLYLNPAIPLDFYAIGFDGDINAGVPQFFLNLGAAKAVRQPSAEDQLLNDAQPVDATPPANLRLLRACDIWLHQPRLGLTSTVLLQPGVALLTGQSSVVQTLGVASPAASDVLRVFQGAFTASTASTAGIDPLSNDYTEPTFDEILVSTVYLLSPPNTPVGSDPDGTWSPYVRHNLFWNLNWAQPPFRQLFGDPGTSLIPPLAAGAAQLVINFLASSLNDATQNALNILTAHSLAGYFWTPTGGGHDATFAALAAAQAPQTGPDRKANLAAQQAAIQAQQRATQLDPDFPYRALPFPTALLSAA
jgi:hypothetical protein